MGRLAKFVVMLNGVSLMNDDEDDDNEPDFDTSNMCNVGTDFCNVD